MKTIILVLIIFVIFGLIVLISGITLYIINFINNKKKKHQSSFNCGGKVGNWNCLDPGDGSGKYPTESACQNDCNPPGPPPPGPPGPPGGKSSNPFDESVYSYVTNPHLTDELKSVAEPAKSALNQPAAFWVDKIEAIKDRTTAYGGSLKDYLNAAKTYSKKINGKVTVVFIVYNLPGRDCAANSSNGELEATPEGMKRYQMEYIGGLVKLLQNYEDLNLVAIIEPDSLGNAVSNLGKYKCTQTVIDYYFQGIIYALKTLATLPNISFYIDAAHGGWLGYVPNLKGFSDAICTKVLGDNLSQEVKDKIRGFSTNVSNYQPLGVSEVGKKATVSTDDPCGLVSQGAPNNEINYITKLNDSLQACKPSSGWHFITDTGRNGLPDARAPAAKNCQNWCNIKGGLGLPPTSDTQNPDLIDAYFWLKTPGESDGCTQDKCAPGKTADGMCEVPNASAWQFNPAPPAGQFDTNIATTLYTNIHENFEHSKCDSMFGWF